MFKNGVKFRIVFNVGMQADGAAIRRGAGQGTQLLQIGLHTLPDSGNLMKRLQILCCRTQHHNAACAVDQHLLTGTHLRRKIVQPHHGWDFQCARQQGSMGGGAAAIHDKPQDQIARQQHGFGGGQRIGDNHAGAVQRARCRIGNAEPVADDAARHILHVNGTFPQIFIREGGQLIGHLIGYRAYGGFGIARLRQNGFDGSFNELRIAEHHQVGIENSGFVAGDTCPHFLAQVDQLITGFGNGLLVTSYLGVQIAARNHFGGKFVHTATNDQGRPKSHACRSAYAPPDGRLGFSMRRVSIIAHRECRTCVRSVPPVRPGLPWFGDPRPTRATSTRRRHPAS